MTESRTLNIQRGSDVIEAELIFCQRRTLEIAVYPDRSVGLRVPVGSCLSIIEDRVKKRFSWIKKQIIFFDQFHPKTTPRRFVNGETHLYLGKAYRLKAIKADTASVILKNGYINISDRTIESHVIRQKLEKWYHKQARVHLNHLFQDCCQNFPVQITTPTIQIRSMKSRWGSFSKSGILTLNSDLIRAPKDCIRYVIYHELCHAVYSDHSKEFYGLLDKVFSDWKNRKQKLEEILS